MNVSTAHHPCDITRRYLPVLFVLMMLFCARVLGQWLVATCDVPFLPPMSAWYSGLIPYPALFLCQIGIILLCGKICLDFWKGTGYFVAPNAVLGKFLTRFAALYALTMIIRYPVQMALHPAERWTGGTIPIVFHIVLASFLLTLGSYHRSTTRTTT